MKYSIVIKSIFVSLSLVGCASAPSEPTYPTSSTMGSLGQAEQALGAIQAYQANGLTGLLMYRLGISQNQAQGGAGALFQMAKTQMQPGTFSQLSNAVPGMADMLKAAPPLQQPSGLGGLASLAGGRVGNMVGLASAFQQSGMSPVMIQQFVPVIVEYVKATGGSRLAGSLGSAFLGL